MKAWDVNALVAKMKDKGLDMAEDAAAIAAEAVLDWAKDSIELTENKVDDIVLPFLPMVETKIKELIDTIDGKKDLKVALAPAVPTGTGTPVTVKDE